MKRLLKYLVAALLGLILLLAVALAAILGSEAGSRWALGLVPGLQVQGYAGRLGGAWQAERLAWSDGATELEVERPQFAWSPACLLQGALCIDRLIVERVQLRLAPGPAEPSEGPIQLPALKLPLAVRLGEVRLGSFLLDGNEQVSNVQASAHWEADGLHIDVLKAARGDLAVDLSGLLTPQGNWPLQAQGSLRLPAPGEQPWELKLQAKGELLGHLLLEADSSGYLQGHLSGDLQPLAENLPASAKITADGFRGAADLPDTLVLNKVQLQAAGDLAAGYRINGSAVLPGEGGDVALDLQGRVDAKGADIAALNLTAAPEQRLGLSGRLDWQEGFAADAKLDWLDFPWLRLYPMEPPPVSMHRLQADLQYRDEAYLGNFAAELSGPAGAFQLSSPVSGNLAEVHLPSLQLVAGQGKAEGSLGLKFADTLAWDAQLKLSDFDPAYWVAELPGKLGGPLSSQGSFKNGVLAVQANLDLQGRLRGQPAVFKTAANGQGQNWKVDGLELRLGDNRISGQASLDQRLAGRLDIALARLGQLWPQLQGQLNGRLDLAGSLKAPQGELSLKGQRLAFQDNGVRSLDLSARLDAAQRGRLELLADGVRAGDTRLGQFKASGQGDLQRQQLDLSLQGRPLVLALGFDGTWNGRDWRGRLAKGEIQSGGQDWRLQQPARLERLADGRLNLGAHCWASGPASLCGGEQRLLPEPQLRWQLRDFPLDSLARWLPEDFAWQGKLNGDVKLDLPARGPNGNILLDAGAGTLRLKEQDQWLDFPYQSLRLESRLTPTRIDSSLQFHGNKLGTLDAQAVLDPRPKNKPLSGSFTLAGLDLAVARPFVPMVETLKGRLDGNGRISGGLMQPRLDGELRLSGGELSGGDLPTRLANLQVLARIAGERVDLSGTWSGGDKGNGSLGGYLAWSQGLDMDLAVRGTDLPVSVEPYANLEVTPDLALRMADQKLSVSGKVQVPRGAIVIRQLPPSTVKLSDDTLIVGAPPKEQGGPHLAMDVDVLVGQDKLTFSGFGLSAELAGQVHIGDDMDTRGELSLNKGRYRAYGQKLSIRRARLLFAGPIDQPYLDIEAIRKVDDVIAGLRLTGNAEQPRSEVFSEPAMSQEQALSYLVMGRPLSTGEDSNMLGEAALALGLAGSAPITGEVARQLGIKDFELGTEGTGTSTSVVASGQLSERLSLRYGVGVFEPANTIALRYLLSKKVYLEAASGLASSLDIFYKRDF